MGKHTRAILEQISDSIDSKTKLKREAEVIEKIAVSLIKAINSGRTIFLLGNGGSAADAQHIAAELVGQYGHKIKRSGIPAIALTTNTSTITAIGNDLSFDKIFYRQVEAFVKSGDVIIGISTSGKSKNVIEAIKLAKLKGALAIAFTGKNKNPLSEICDIVLHAPSTSTQRIQECHITVGHILCDLVENNLNNKFFH
ncbi:MAG: D-sedoheptulose-7-phosphate isomerase [Nitrosotalea sp.]